MKEQAYFEQNRDKHLAELNEWLSIPSISAISEHKEDIQRAAQWAADALTRAGMENVEIIQTAGHPIVYADHLHAPGKPTALIYGHYDVQPVDPLHLWETPPFEPTVRDGKLYARGATDDKGQIFIHIKAVEALLAENKELPINVKFCIEGEEEISSPNLPIYLNDHTDKLRADMVLISDTSLLEKGKPAISTGLRGLCSMHVDLFTANTDLHSGSFGGGVPNALHALVSLLASLHDEQGRVSVDGFYDGVLPLSPEMREEFTKQGFNEEQLRQDLGLEHLYGEEGYSFVERVGARPTLELNGVWGGFRAKAPKPSFRKRHMPKSPAVWLQIRTRSMYLMRLKRIFAPMYSQVPHCKLNRSRRLLPLTPIRLIRSCKKPQMHMKKYTAYVPSSPRMAARFRL